MLKLGTFGFLRFALPLFPGAAMHPTVRAAILGLAVVIGIVYGALVAMVQPDFKKLVAYSSVSHLGFVMLGIFALTPQSVQGALMIMINHGISTGALFLLIGMIYERSPHARDRRVTAASPAWSRCSRQHSSSWRSAASACRAPTASSASSCAARRLQDVAAVRARRVHGRHLRGRVPALGDPAHALQSARQAGERDLARPQPARARRGRRCSRWHHLARASAPRRCCAAWSPPPHASSSRSSAERWSPRRTRDAPPSRPMTSCRST